MKTLGKDYKLNPTKINRMKNNNNKNPNKKNQKKINNKSKNKLNKIIYILIIITIFEILLSGLLTLAKYNNSIAALCGDDLSNSCNTVQNSEFSNLIDIKSNNGYKYEIPISFVGVIFFTIFLYFLIKLKLELFHNHKNYFRNISEIILGMSIIAFIISIIYTLIQAFIIKAYCKFCLTSAINSTIIFIIVNFIYFKYLKNKKNQ